MAIAMLVDIPSFTQGQYEQVAQSINQAQPPLAAPLIHMAGDVNGGCRVIEVWESQETANTFYGSDFFRHLLANIPQPTITTWSLYTFDGIGLKQTS